MAGREWQGGRGLSPGTLLKSFPGSVPRFPPGEMMPTLPGVGICSAFGRFLSKPEKTPSHVEFPCGQKPSARPTPPLPSPPQEALLVGEAGPARQGPAG